MSFMKFFDLVTNRSLFFSPLSDLNDQFEGSTTKGNKKRNKKARKRVIELIEQRFEKDDRFSKDDKKRFIDEFTKEREITPHRQQITVNCWHLNNYESNAMWSLYSKMNYGIAIVSSLKSFHQVLDQSAANVMCGKVVYIDYENDIIEKDGKSYMYKRKSFQHEKEYRAVIDKSAFTNSKLFGDGDVKLEVNIEKLVDKVLLSPFTPTWQENLIKNLSKKLGFEAKITRSKLEEKPIF